MSFTAVAYEQAIVRIFDGKGNVIGTGFLVAPGYVLTCAHVVLQAIGIPKDKFLEYEGQPLELIALDFHVLAAGQRIQSEVVAWLPYGRETGDMAALRLLSPEPQQAQPMPLVEVLWDAVTRDEHDVYGFPDGGGSVGTRSDAYRPKGYAAGGRFQLCKFGDPSDETIKPGFSGAPVWNERLKSVIGMVATANAAKDEQQRKAYAIPTKELQPLLKQIAAFRLDDILNQSLAACSSDDQRDALRMAIATPLRRCNPQGTDRPWREQLLDLSIDRAPMANWETEGRLVHFAMLLAKMDDISAIAYDQLKSWVESCQLNFRDLLDRVTREMKQQKVSTSSVCQHLMVVVEQKETALDELRVSIWSVPDRDTYNPQTPMLPVVRETELTFRELPKFIRDQVWQKFRKVPTPMIHLFVSRSLFDRDIAMAPRNERGNVLGSEYPLVVRTNLKQHPIGYGYYDDWNTKWEELFPDDKTCDVFKLINCAIDESILITEIIATNAAMLQDCDSVGDLFELIADETALPVALWSRDPQFQGQLPNVLDCVVKELHNRIRQERAIAHQSPDGTMLGHHLSLVLEDPKIVPPDMFFDPEAC